MMLRGERGALLRRQWLTHGYGVMPWLVAINVAVFVAAWIAEALSSPQIVESALLLPAWPGGLLHRPWTLLTYMFTHLSFLHLLFNMLWLWWFGRLSETMLTWRSTVWAYLAGGVAGGLLYVGAGTLGAIAPGSHLVGASASVMCIMTVAAVVSPNLEFNFLLVGSVRLKWIAPICILLAFLGLGGGNSGGVTAHIGGVVTGVTIGAWQRRRLNASPQAIRATAAVRRRFRKAGRITTPATATNASANTDAAQRLDQLLDKIRISGYASLSLSERNELQRLSKELKS